MSGISHKQAVQFIDRRMDGILNDSQRSLLEEHLRSCDSCRAYAIELEGFSAHLQNEFHRRWDDSFGPSQNVTGVVMSTARRIPLTIRISSGVKVFAGALAFVLLAVAINFVISRLQSPPPTTTDATETIDHSPLPEDRLLAFTSNQNGNSEIYTMHPDGSGLTNITNHSANDSYPFWSPDGKQIAFMSDRDGSPQIYLMDADGSNVTQLTQGEGRHLLDVNGNTPWSPDGRKLIYSYKSPEEANWRLYVKGIDKNTSTTLTDEPGEYILPSWSPNGRHIAFTAESDRAANTRDLFVVSSDGSNLVRLTENLSAGEIFLFGDYSWSQDGTSITFSTHSYGQVGQSSAYEASLDGSLTVLARTDKFMIDWWNGTALQEDSEGKTLTWLRSNSSQSALNLCQSDDSIRGIAYKRSNDGNLFFASNCSGRGWVLYRANPDGTIVNELLGSPIPANGNTDHIFNMTWSPDDRYLAFVALHIDSNSDASETLYILDVAEARNDPSLQLLKMPNTSGPSWQPVVDENLTEEIPTPEPTQVSSSQGLLAFAAASENGNLDIYTMRPDGSDLTNLTNNPAHDANPVWSPDGKRIAFESDRSGFMQIYLMDPDGSNVIQLTEAESDHRIENFNPWSPDGSRLVFLERAPGEEQWMLYGMDADGENKTFLVSEPSIYGSVSWSPDGEHIAFVSNNPQNQGVLRMNVVDPDGKHLTDITEFLQTDERLDSFQYDWSDDGQSIFFVAYRHFDEGRDQWIAYEAGLDNNRLIENAVSSTPMDSWWEGTSFIRGFDLSTLTWLRPDGSYSTLNPLEHCQLADNSQYGFLAKRSSNGKLLISVNCPNDDIWLYYATSDGTSIKQLLDVPLSEESFKLSGLVWSPDEKFIALNIFSSDRTDMYVLNISEALTDPSIQPLRITLGGGAPVYYGSSSWQPVP